MSKGNGQADVSLEEQLKDEQLKDEQKQAMENELPAAESGGWLSGKERFCRRSPGFRGDWRGERVAKSCAQSAMICLSGWRGCRPSLTIIASARQKRMRSIRDFAVSDAARALLPVIDSFTLALKNSAAKPEDLRKGVELIFKQLQDVLQKLNIERIPSQGEPFDPRVHEAIEMVETDDAPDHHVLEELQPGYRIKGRLLRPAMVRVAKKIG